MSSTIASPQIDPQDSKFNNLPEDKKQHANKRGNSSNDQQEKSKDEKVVKSASSNETAENAPNLGTGQDVVTTNQILIPKKNKKLAKKIAGNVFLALAAGATAVTPVVVYYKNKKYEVVVESEVDNFTAYSITVKRGESISNLKTRLNEFVGHNLVGIYKDSYCTIPFSESDKVTKNTKVYLKYERIKYVVTMPESLEHCDIIYTTSEDLSAIEWGTKFSFVVKLKEDFQNSYDRSNIQVLVNGVAINPDAVWNDDKEITYTIDFVEQDLNIEVTGLSLNRYSLQLPTSEEGYSIDYDNSVDITSIEHGSEFKFKVNFSEEFSQADPSVFANGEEIEKDAEGYYSVVVTDDVVIQVGAFELNTYNIILPTGEYTIISSAEQVSWGENIDFEVVLNEGYDQSNIIVKANGQVVEKNEFGKYQVLDIRADINIEIEGVKLNKYSISLPTSDKYTFNYEQVFDLASIAHGSTFRFEVELSQAYTQSNIMVYVNNKLVSKNEYGEYVIENIKSAIVVKIEGIQLNKYTVTWTNYDGTVLEVDENVYHGSSPEYDGEIPTKESTPQYSYAFSGWNNEIESVEGDLVLTAMFTELVNQYVVSWVNYDGVELLSERLDYGSVPSYYGETPVKTSDYRYNYNFVGWDKEINEVVGNVTYKAVFVSEEKTSYALVINDSSNVTVTAKRNNVYANITAGENVYEDEKLFVNYNETNGYIMSEFSLNNQEYVLKTGQSLEVNVASDISIHYTQVDTCGLTFEKGKNGYTVVSYDGSTSNVNIPKKILNESVVNIKSGTSTNLTGVFKDASEVESVYIPNTITGNLSYVFYGCSNLTNVEFEDNSGIQEIGTSAFYGCEKLEAVNLGEGSQLVSFGIDSFATSGIKKMFIPNTVTSIKSRAFENCGSLNTLVFEENSSLDTIGSSAFKNCSSLSSVEIPESLGTIGSSAFSGCNSLTRVVINNKDVYDLAGNKAAFAGALLANAVEVEVLKTIDDGSNEYLNSYKYVKEEKGNYYLYRIAGEYSLSCVGPNVVVEVERDGQNLTLTHTDIVYEMEEVTIKYTETEGYVMSEFIVNGEAAQNGISLVVGKSFSVSYKEVLAYGLTFEINEDGTGYIVIAHDGLKLSVVIPEKIYNLPVLEIGNEAFSRSQITNIIIPEGVLSIGNKAFTNSQITSINLPSSLKVIGSYAFSGCVFNEVELPEGVELVDDGYELFSYCSNLTTVRLPSTLEVIGEHMFAGCGNLESVNLPNGLISIMNDAFGGCAGLKEIELPNQLKTIERYAFNGCSSLIDIVIPESVESIGEEAFVGCLNLSNVIIHSRNIYNATTGTQSTIVGGLLQNITTVRVLKSIDDGSNKFLNGYLYIRSEIGSYYSYRYAETYSLTINSDNVLVIAERNGESVMLYNDSTIYEEEDLIVTYLESDGYVMSEFTLNGETYTLDSGTSLSVNVGGEVVINYVEVDACGLTFTINSEETGYIVTAYDGSEPNIVIPSRVNNLPVVDVKWAIDENDLEGIFEVYARNVQTIYFPGTIESVYRLYSGQNTDYNELRNLREVTFGEGVKHLYETFECCYHTELSVHLPTTLETIGEKTFCNSSISEIEIPNSVKVIGNSAFLGCTNLTSIILPSSLERIGSAAFSCSNIAEMQIADGTELVDSGMYLFDGCSNLVRVKLPKNLTEIGYSMFYNCSALKEIIIPTEVMKINNYAFAGCSNLNQITIPANVENVLPYAFDNCKNLTDITIDSSDIYEKLVGNEYNVVGGILSNATTVVVPEEVVNNCSNSYLTGYYHQLSGGLYTFKYGRYKLNVVASMATNALTMTTVRNGSTITLNSGDWLYEGEVVKVSYKESAGWMMSTFEINGYPITLTATEHAEVDLEGPINNGYIDIEYYEVMKYGLTYTVASDHVEVTAFDGVATSVQIYDQIHNKPVTVIGNNVFQKCESLTSVLLPLTITSIGDNAFEQSGISSINLPEGLISIGASAFNLVDLTSLVIPSTVESIGNNAFRYCKMEKVVIPKSVVTFGGAIFHNNLKLKEVIFEEGCTVMGASMFLSCEKLTSVTIPSSITEIPNIAFEGCKALTSINLPSSITRIGLYAFNGTMISTINLSEKLKIIDSYAFSRSGLTEITIPSSVTTIGDSVFYDCSSLTSVTIPNKTINYGTKIFQKCTALQSIVLPETWTTITDLMFYGCSALSAVYTNGKITNIGKQAFYDCVLLKSFELTEDLVSVGYAAFWNTGLTSVTIPLIIQNWGSHVFGSCKSLTTINWIYAQDQSDNINELPAYMFSGCKSLKSIDLPSNIEVIREGAFQNCSSLTEISVVFVKTIESSAFSGCTSLTNIYLGSSYIYNNTTSFDSFGRLFYYALHIDIPTHVYKGTNIFFETEFEVKLLGGRYQLRRLY